ncbi:MAG: transporter substrate-binding domain-containing protein [Alphaproteobacteria bacterium]|nr:transporter substrate-binding domain-containing protein [Alphaproteobacteria bacterium]
MRYFLSIFFALVITFSLPVFAKPASSKSAQEQEKQSGKGRYHEYQEEEQTKKKETYRFENGCGSKGHPIVYATFTNYPPFGWVEKFEPYMAPVYYEAHGLAQKLLNHIAKKTEIAVMEKSFATYNQAVRALDRGEIDLLLGTYFDGDPYSHKAYVFPAFTNNPFILVALKGKMPPINGWEDLKGKKVVLRNEEGLWPMIEGIIPDGIHFKYVTGARNAFKLLVNKEADFILSSRYAVETEIARFKLNNFIDISDKFLKEPKLFFAFYKDGECNTKIRKIFEEEMKTLANDGEFMSFLFNDTIKEWKEKFKDEPSILIREGFEMDDDMASFFEEEEKETATQETRKKKLADLDVDILVNALTKPVSDEKKTDEDGNDDTETQTTESEQPPASASIPFPESENLK